MKDFLEQELNVGDTVVLILPGYRELTKGTIVRFTKCFVIVLYRKPWGGVHDGNTEVKQTPNQLVKVQPSILP